ncbi:hypothetical protein VNO80_01594 [Phaseolus coccineus]|uniref:Uncharacterized protein n=1 Tax=Phaseolus coccineus TaxID=3886 RepID=A0AAN9RT07_PHACN
MVLLSSFYFMRAFSFWRAFIFFLFLLSRLSIFSTLVLLSAFSFLLISLIIATGSSSALHLSLLVIFLVVTMWFFSLRCSPKGTVAGTKLPYLLYSPSLRSSNFSSFQIS